VKFRSLLKFLVHFSRFALAALFLFTAGAKIVTAKGFAENLANLVGVRWAWPVTVAVIVCELLAVALLVWPRTLRMGGIWSALLLVGFAGYALYYVYVLHGEPLECGCFGGIIASQLGVSTALRNLALLIPALLIIFGVPRLRRREQSIPEQTEASLTV
jgi:hypothetical protein